jgi:hypothetical protein
MGINPKTQQKIKIPAKTVVKFRVAKAAKDAVLGGVKGEKRLVGSGQTTASVLSASCPSNLETKVG